MKNRLLAAVMSILLMLAMPAMAATAEASSGFKVDADRNIQSIAVTKTQIYILDRDGNITARTAASWKEKLVGMVNQYSDSDKPEEKEKEVIISELIELDDKLYGINTDDGTIFELVNERGKFSPVRQDVVLDVSALSNSMGDELACDKKPVYPGWMAVLYRD